MSEKIPTYCLGGLLTLILSLPATAQQGPAPNFIPDFTFEDSHFDHWSPTGRATWRTENGVITGNGNQGAGWLVLDETYQNVALFSRFKCTGACDAGILMRMQKTPEGTKGVFVEIKEGTLTAYRVQLNSAGEFITKVSVKGDSRPGGGEDAPPGSVLARANAELTAPVTVQHNVWNSIEVIVNENLVYNHLNNVRYAIPGGEIEDLPPLAPNEYNGAVVTPNTRTYG